VTDDEALQYSENQANPVQSAQEKSESALKEVVVVKQPAAAAAPVVKKVALPEVSAKSEDFRPLWMKKANSDTDAFVAYSASKNE